MLDILTIILPVFFMIGVGICARTRKWVTKEQADGLNAVIGKVLFPIMVFNALFTTSVEASALLVIGYVFALHMFAIFVGHIIGRITNSKYAHVSKYLMCTVDGGNVCYPLYATIVGASFIGNVVMLDIACILIVFLVIPLMVAAKASRESDAKAMLKGICTSPLIVTIALGMILNRMGVYDLLGSTGWDAVYSSIVSTATSPVVGSILFMLGYQFKIQKSSIKPLLITVLSRVAVMALGIWGLLTLFLEMCQDKAFFIVVLLYFMCPPALVLVNQVAPLCDEDDTSFLSAFISMYMIVTLIAYTVIVVFVA